MFVKDTSEFIKIWGKKLPLFFMSFNSSKITPLNLYENINFK